MIFAFVIALASCMAIRPRPPAPIITKNSGEFTFAFFTAVYAVRPEHASDVAASKSSPSIFARYL